MSIMNALISRKTPPIPSVRPWYPMQIYLQSPAAELPLLFCNLTLHPDFRSGWILSREIGYQGYPGEIYNEYFSSYAAATHALEQARDAQLVNGSYKITFISGHPPL